MGQVQKPFGYSRIIKTKQEMNNNWVYKEGGNFHKKNGEKVLKKIKEQRKGKMYRMVKVSDYPLTYKEIEVKN
jgi:hypothetical protein